MRCNMVNFLRLQHVNILILLRVNILILLQRVNILNLLQHVNILILLHVNILILLQQTRNSTYILLRVAVQEVSNHVKRNCVMWVIFQLKKKY